MLCSGVSNEGVCQISKPDSSRNQRKKNIKKIEIHLVYVVVTPHAQRERGKVIGRGVHIYIYLLHRHVKRTNQIGS